MLDGNTIAERHYQSDMERSNARYQEVRKTVLDDIRYGEIDIAEALDIPGDAHRLALASVWNTDMGPEPDVSCAMRDFNANLESFIADEIERRLR